MSNSNENNNTKRPRGRPRKNPVADTNNNLQGTDFNQLDDIFKANSEALAVSRLRLSEIGSAALQQMKYAEERAKAVEVRWPMCLITFENMRNDSTIHMALALKQMFIERAFNKWTIQFNKKSKKSKEAAEFVEYCFSNLDGQTLRQIAGNASSFNVYGFSAFEKIWTKINSGKYKGKYDYRLSKLAPRPQPSLDPRQPFKFSMDGREVIGMWQNPIAFQNNYGMQFFGWMNDLDPREGTVFIDIKKLALFTLNGSLSNPMGRSPLIACYKPYREKVILENLEVVGATKSLAGIAELKIPSSILQKASLNPLGQEATFLKQLMTDTANLHKGEQSYMILPSDVQQGNTPQYSMTLKGVEGRSGGEETTKLINERKKLILDVFGAGFVNLGNESHGSYSLSEGKQSLHAHFVENDINTIEEVFNEDIIPQMLALNGILLDDADMPVLVAGDIDQNDLGVFSSAVQRMGATGYLPKNKEVINHIMEMMNIDWRVTNETQEQLNEMLGQPTTRAGDGMKEGLGNGTGSGVKDRDASVSNNARETS